MWGKFFSAAPPELTMSPHAVDAAALLESVREGFGEATVTDKILSKMRSTRKKNKSRAMLAK